MSEHGPRTLQARTAPGAAKKGGEINRRQVLGMSVALVGGVILDRLAFQDDDATKPAKKELGYDPKAVNDAIIKGLQSKWKDVAVFPGFMMADSGTKLYHDPLLSVEAEPIFGGGSRLGILRPVFAAASLGFHIDELGNSADAYRQAQPVSPGTIGFLGTNPKDPTWLFTKYDPEHINAMTRVNRATSVPVYGELVADQVYLDGRKKGGEQLIPYLELDHFDYDFNSPKDQFTKSFKLVGVSAVYNSPTEANNQSNYFLATNQTEPITLASLK
jgi:hypothetical protein